MSIENKKTNLKLGFIIIGIFVCGMVAGLISFSAIHVYFTGFEKGNEDLKNQINSQNLVIKQLINNTEKQGKFNQYIIDWGNSVEKRLEMLNSTKKLSK